VTPILDWNRVYLKHNPFADTPPRRPEEAVWAGLPRLKAQFEALLVPALATPATQVVLNWGAWGSGKTHAAVYFGLSERLLPLAQPPRVKAVRPMYIRTPKEPARADEILYRDIVEAMRFSHLRQLVRSLIAAHGQEEALRLLQDSTASEPLGRAVWLLGLEPHKRGGQLALFGEEPSADWDQLLEAYFFSTCTRRDLKELGQSRGIDSSQDRFRVLGTLLQCAIGFAPVEQIEQHTRVILWIDELEDLIYFQSRQYRPFTQGLRDLIDRLPNYLTLLMNFTLAAPEAFEDAMVVMGDALKSRITHRIYFQPPSPEEAYEYVVELLRQYRSEEPTSLGLPETYPFTPEALQALIAALPALNRTPRDLNKGCSQAISQALLSDVIPAPGAGLITPEFVAEFVKTRLDLDLG
jgi:hypothetical protein